LLAEGRLAGFGLAEPSVVLQRRADQEIAAMQIALAGSTDAPTRVERLPGPFLWYF
jgi:hypothetical protein